MKFIYWLEKEKAEEVDRDLKAKGIKVRHAKGVVCTPLDPINKISIVEPGVWDDVCTRAGAWYWASDRAGLHLLVSSFEVEGLTALLAGTITKTEFSPPRYATAEEKQALVSELEKTGLIPDNWRRIDGKEKELYLKWARRLGARIDEWDTLYLTHTANHANFLSPRLSIEGHSGPVPYSIERSALLCSCCLELYQVMGGKFKEKLVAPCPGACLFARLKPDQYLLVRSPDTTEAPK